MVANKRSLSPSKREIRWSAGFFFSSMMLRSEGESEKNAISDAEAKAEKSNRKAATTMATMAAADGCWIVMSLNTANSWDKNESESKELQIS